MNLLLRPRFPETQGMRPVVQMLRPDPAIIDSDDDTIIPIIVAIHESKGVLNP